MRFLSDAERDSAISVARQFPIIVIDRAEFAGTASLPYISTAVHDSCICTIIHIVLGDPAITPGSIVTLTVVIRKINSLKITDTGALAESIQPDKDTPIEEIAPRAWWKPEETGPLTHAPLFPKVHQIRIPE